MCAEMREDRKAHDARTDKMIAGMQYYAPASITHHPDAMMQTPTLAQT